MQSKKIHQYEISKLLGQGAFGKVLLVKEVIDDPFAKHPKEVFYAMKTFPQVNTSKAKLARGKGQTAVDKINYEIAVMRRLIHPNIVSLHEVRYTYSMK
jgi:serine/threonine protein kinase